MSSTARVRIPVSGMTCAACQARVQRTLVRRPGVHDASVNLLTAGVMGWAGRHFYTRAWAALRHRAADMNTLVAVGTGAAFLFSAAATLFPGWFHAAGGHGGMTGV